MAVLAGWICCVFCKRAALRPDPTRVDYLIIHCTATDPTTCHYTPALLHQDHLARGFLAIGYHFYVTTDGTPYQTRGLQEIGAHCSGYNLHSLALAYEGGYDYFAARPANTLTPQQHTTLQLLLHHLHTLYPTALLRGHRDMPHVQKSCPSLDAQSTFTLE